MKLKVTSIYADQENALRFYADVLGLVKKADVIQGPYRWLTVASAEEPDGVELQLAPNDNPAAHAYQQAMFEQGQPAAMFYVDDVQREHERMTAAGAEFTMPPTKVTGSTIAMLNDRCGNLIQITKLHRSSRGSADLRVDRSPLPQSGAVLKVRWFPRHTAACFRIAGLAGC
jgi:predicted enzyme related to lactoylglutathione lyase